MNWFGLVLLGTDLEQYLDVFWGTGMLLDLTGHENNWTGRIFEWQYINCTILDLYRCFSKY